MVTRLDRELAFGERGERFEVGNHGTRNVELIFKGLTGSIEQGLLRTPRIVATADHCVNAIPYVCAAPPGIKTYLDLH